MATAQLQISSEGYINQMPMQIQGAFHADLFSEVINGLNWIEKRFHVDVGAAMNDIMANAFSSNISNLGQQAAKTRTTTNDMQTMYRFRDEAQTEFIALVNKSLSNASIGAVLAYQTLQSRASNVCALLEFQLSPIAMAKATQAVSDPTLLTKDLESFNETFVDGYGALQQKCDNILNEKQEAEQSGQQYVHPEVQKQNEQSDQLQRAITNQVTSQMGMMGGIAGKMMNKALGPPPVQHEGSLTKQGGVVKNWKRRWMCIRNGCLEYHEDRSKAMSSWDSPKGKIPLREVIQIIDNTDTETSKANAFALVTRDRTWQMYADSQTERAKWVEALQKSLK